MLLEKNIKINLEDEEKELFAECAQMLEQITDGLKQHDCFYLKFGKNRFYTLDYLENALDALETISDKDKNLSLTDIA